jgi:glycosyltransferase involved in cell wall biosynthesis
MRAAFLSSVHGHKWPGSEYLWSACAQKLLDSGHRVFVGVGDDFRGAEPLENLQDAGATVEFISPGFSRAARLLQKVVSPYRAIKAFRPDLLVVSSGSAFDPCYQPALGKFLAETTIPYIFICHFNAETFWVDEPMRALMATIFAKAQRTVFVSRETHRITERQLASSVPRPVVIVPPLLGNVLEPLPWPDASADGSLKFACVARLEPRWKGQDVLFEVLADRRWRERNYRLNLFGQGAEEQYLRRLAKFYRLEDKVSFAGFASPEKIWQEHHLQVLATRGEGGPMVVTEGMMCGRIAVTTRCGFVPDYVTDGATGFLADFATAACFGDALERAWAGRADWREMGCRAHESVKARLDEFNSPEQLLRLMLATEVSGNAAEIPSSQ